MERSVEAPEAGLGLAGWRDAIATEYLSILGLAVAALLVYGAMRRGPTRPIRALGALWFTLAFLPISNLVELNATVAEHWLYLPSVGLLIFLVGCAMELPIQARRFASCVACIAVIALTTRSTVRSRDWMSAETFYRSSLAAGAAKPRMALNLGIILTAKGDYAKAEPLLRKVVQFYPDYPIAINALAHVLFRSGKLEEANRLFKHAEEVAERTRNDYPRTWIAALNLAHMHYHDHDLQGAIAIIDKARTEYPGTWELISFESEAHR